jgi:hypothetical protein
MTESRFRNAVLLLLVTAISVAFVAMIRGFLVPILVAAIFAGPSFLFTLGGLMLFGAKGLMLWEQTDSIRWL